MVDKSSTGVTFADIASATTEDGRRDAERAHVVNVAFNRFQYALWHYLDGGCGLRDLMEYVEQHASRADAVGADGDSVRAHAWREVCSNPEPKRRRGARQGHHSMGAIISVWVRVREARANGYRLVPGDADCPAFAEAVRRLRDVDGIEMSAGAVMAVWKRNQNPWVAGGRSDGSGKPG